MYDNEFKTKEMYFHLPYSRQYFSLFKNSSSNTPLVFLQLCELLFLGFHSFEADFI